MTINVHIRSLLILLTTVHVALKHYLYKVKINCFSKGFNKGLLQYELIYASR